MGSVELAAAVVMLYTILPSITKSLTPVAVTVCVVLQLTVLKVTLDGDTVPSKILLLLRLITTLAIGWVLSTIVKVAVPPASVVTSPEVGLTVIPTKSLSLLVAPTSATGKLL